MSELRFDVVGAEGPKRYFGSLTRDRLAHAYLFHGPAGCGKKTFARKLAQSLLCERQSDAVLGYDGTCPSCVLLEQNAFHPDLLEHDGVLKIGNPETSAALGESEDVSARDLIRQLTLQSYAGGKHVLLLGDLSFATHEAPNALLKFLEEPPQQLVVLMTSSAPGNLLPTVRSRALEIRFSPLTKAHVRTVLERLGYAAGDVEVGTALAGGSVSRAIAALAPEEESLRAAVAGWFFDCAGGGAPEEPWATRETLDNGLEMVKALVRDWIAVGVDPGAALVSPDYGDRLRGLGPLSARSAAAMLDRLGEAQRLARTNVAPGLVGELVRMAITKTG